MKQVNFFFVFLLAFLSVTVGQAQPLGQVSGFPSLKKPEKYTKPDGTIVPAGAPAAKGVSAYWFVFSDRDNNTTYESPGGSKAYKKLMLGQAFWVIAESGDYVRLVKVEDNTYDLGNGKVTLNAKANPYDYGWISKQNLLLWSESLFKNGFKEKVMAVHTAESLKDPVKYASASKIYVYNSPDLKTTNDKSLELMQFLFVYKISNNAYLVGIYPDLQRDQGGYILGWVSSATIQSWGDRVVLEPKIGQSAGSAPTVFKDEESAKAYAQSGMMSNEQNIWTFKNTQGLDPYWKRPPILGRVGNLVRTGIVTGVYDDKGTEIIPVEDYINIAEGIEKGRSTQFNLVFVVEGRKGVGEKGLEAANRVLSDAQSSFNSSSRVLKTGAVVYYDKGAPISAMEGISEPEKTVAFLGAELIKSSNGKADADMLGGLNRAFSLFGSKKGISTNVIILIGAATEGEDQPERTAQIARLAAESRVHLLAFQIAGGEDYAYENFATQLKDIIIQASKIIARQAEEALAVSGEVVRMEPSLTPTPDFFKVKLDYPVKSPVAGYIMFAENSSAIRTASQLQESASGMLKELREKSSATLQSLDAKVIGVGPRDVEGQAISSMLGDIVKTFKTQQERESFIQLVKSKNFQFFVEGYTPIKQNGTGYEYYDYALLLTALELSEITLFVKKEILDKSMEEGPQIVRENIVTAYKKIMREHVGSERLTEEEMMGKTPAEVIEMLTGIPSSSKLLQEYTLRDLEDPAVVSDDQIAKIREYFSTKYQALYTLSNGGIVDLIERSFKVAGENYYWVPQSFVP